MAKKKIASKSGAAEDKKKKDAAGLKERLGKRRRTTKRRDPKKEVATAEEKEELNSFRDTKGRFIKGAGKGLRELQLRGAKAPKLHLKTLLHNFLREKYAEGTDKSNADYLVEQLVKIGHRGNVQAIRECFDRIDGKVPDVVHQQISMLGDMSEEELDNMIAADGGLPSEE